MAEVPGPAAPPQGSKLAGVVSKAQAPKEAEGNGASSPGGDPELHRRIRLVTDKHRAAVVDVFTGNKVCHRFMIPFHLEIPKPNTLNPKVMDVEVRPNMGHVSCIGVKCALWNDEAKECFDVTEKRASHDTARILEVMDGYARLHTSES